eukprot:14965475-Alexandrium_andersonii.AAC.1
MATTWASDHSSGLRSLAAKWLKQASKGSLAAVPAHLIISGQIPSNPGDLPHLVLSKAAASSASVKGVKSASSVTGGKSNGDEELTSALRSAAQCSDSR